MKNTPRNIERTTTREQQQLPTFSLRSLLFCLMTIPAAYYAGTKQDDITEWLQKQEGPKTTAPNRLPNLARPMRTVPLAVQFEENSDIIQGYPDGTFRPLINAESHIIIDDEWMIPTNKNRPLRGGLFDEEN